MSVVSFHPELSEDANLSIRLRSREQESDAALRTVLARVGVEPARYRDACRSALRNGSEPADELVAGGVVTEDALARAVAEALGVPFANPGREHRSVGSAHSGSRRYLRACSPNLQPTLFIAPPLETLDRLAEWIERNGTECIAITTPTALRRHEAAESDAARLQDARLSLAADRPRWSAREVLDARQGYALGASTVVAVALAWTFGGLVPTVLHALVSLFFFACTVLRLLVLLDLGNERRRLAVERRRRDDRLTLPVGTLPVYSILVALYRETEMVDPLVESLARLNWPATRLDIQLVCEADDRPTVDAVRQAIRNRVGFSLVEVPPSAPRTKPKALNHALPMARGEIVAVFDAEDRPDPDQLLEAWLAFREAGDELACVQAPLEIRNGAENWRTALFAVEYAVQFRALYPFLARRRLPIPLGGTSNHFRIDVLRRVGGWDSHNVAEDADLGIRLARFGYRTDMITAPTSEIAPVEARDWLHQRSRWVKGWIQTYCVHMRRPVETARDLGWLRMTAFQILFIWMMAGAVMHTAFLVFASAQLLRLATLGSVTLPSLWLLAVDLVNVAAAVTVFAALAVQVLRSRERTLLRALAMLWFYWLMVSVATVRSVRQLFVAPHQWEKTPHFESAPGTDEPASETVPASVSDH